MRGRGERGRGGGVKEGEGGGMRKRDEEEMGTSLGQSPWLAPHQ